MAASHFNVPHARAASGLCFPTRITDAVTRVLRCIGLHYHRPIKPEAVRTVQRSVLNYRSIDDKSTGRQCHHVNHVYVDGPARSVSRTAYTPVYPLSTNHQCIRICRSHLCPYLCTYMHVELLFTVCIRQCMKQGYAWPLKG